MNRRRNMGAYGAGYSPADFSFGDFMGNLGNSWQGGEDQAMFGANPQNLPFATTTGAYYAGQVAAETGGQVVGAVTAPVIGFVQGMLQGAFRGAAVMLGAGIIIVTLINARER